MARSQARSWPGTSSARTTCHTPADPTSRPSQPSPSCSQGSSQQPPPNAPPGTHAITVELGAPEPDEGRRATLSGFAGSAHIWRNGLAFGAAAGTLYPSADRPLSPPPGRDNGDSAGITAPDRCRSMRARLQRPVAAMLAATSTSTVVLLIVEDGPADLAVTSTGLAYRWVCWAGASLTHARLVDDRANSHRTFAVVGVGPARRKSEAAVSLKCLPEKGNTYPTNPPSRATCHGDPAAGQPPAVASAQRRQLIRICCSSGSHGCMTDTRSIRYMMTSRLAS
jgi:hypothetical protein